MFKNGGQRRLNWRVCRLCRALAILGVCWSLALNTKKPTLVVNAFDFYCRYIISGMSNDSFKVIAQKPLEPEQMRLIRAR